MSRALPLTQREVTAICEGAKKAGYAPIIQIRNVLVRLVPEEHAIRSLDEKRIDEPGDPEAFESLDQYLAWRDRNHAREDQGNS